MVDVLSQKKPEVIKDLNRLETIEINSGKKWGRKGGVKETQGVEKIKDLPGVEQTVKKEGGIIDLLEEKREETRAAIAKLLIYLLGVEIILSIIYPIIHMSFFKDLPKPDHIKEIKDMITIFFTPTVALVGAATGFYYGGKITK
jgi:hypothetical protein